MTIYFGSYRNNIRKSIFCECKSFVPKICSYSSPGLFCCFKGLMMQRPFLLVEPSISKTGFIWLVPKMSSCWALLFSFLGHLI